MVSFYGTCTAPALLMAILIQILSKRVSRWFSGIELSNYEIAQIAAVGRYLHDPWNSRTSVSVMAEVDLVP